MKLRSATLRLAVLGIWISLSFSACQEPGIDIIPEDGPPAISILSPDNTNLLRRKEEPFTVQIQLADNEALNVLRIVGKVFDEGDTEVGDFQVPDIPVSGTTEIVDYTDKVPVTAEPYYKVRYTCYAIDSKGAFASTFFWVSVLPEPTDPAPFVVLTYEGDSVFNSKASVGYAFNFTSRMLLPVGTNNNKLDFDIAESSGTAQAIFQPRLNSPNNNELGLDSVFVITHASNFNYEEATYETIFRAFFSDPAPATETPVLKVDDYVIVRLTKSPRPQFAVMRIKKIVDDGAGVNIKDRILFDYKVTSQP